MTRIVPFALAALLATAPAHAQTDTRAVAERFVLEFLGQGSIEAAEAVIAPDVVAVTGLSPTAPIEGRDAYVQTFFAFASAFTFETPIENGMVTENVVSATNLEFEMVFAPVLTPLVLGEE